MEYNFDEFKKGVKDVIEWITKELTGIRTGRASITILDGVMVNSYGVKTPLNQTANLSTEDARSIRVKPWDKGLMPEIEKAIANLDLGVSTSADDEGVRVMFPELTTENREKLVKLAKTKTEDAKVSLRNERNVAVKDIEQGIKDGEIPEDDGKRFKEQLQKIMDDATKQIDEILQKKESEILN
jgi:ribosome recycling factor